MPKFSALVDVELTSIALISFLKQRLRELSGVGGLQVVRLLAEAGLQLEVSSWFLHHFAVLPHDDRQAEGAVLGFDVVRGTAQGAFGAGYEGGGFA